MSYVFFIKQKTAYEMRISDWSSDVCSSDLLARQRGFGRERGIFRIFGPLLHRARRAHQAKDVEPDFLVLVRLQRDEERLTPDRRLVIVAQPQRHQVEHVIGALRGL